MIAEPLRSLARPVADLRLLDGNPRRLNRIAYAMELDPAYCDVICARYERHTGVKPELVAG